jgi:hypothetical protein
MALAAVAGRQGCFDSSHVGSCDAAGVFSSINPTARDTPSYRPLARTGMARMRRGVGDLPHRASRDARRDV